jgi:hypothetical protein
MATGDIKVVQEAAGPVFTEIEAKTVLAPLASPIFTGTVTLPTVVLGESSVQLDASISADGKWSGITETGTAGVTLAFGELCYFDVATSKWKLSKADAAATSGGVKLGMCILAANADAATEMLLFGKINAAAKFPALTVGAVCYISAATAGLIVAGAAGATTGQPTGTDHVIRVIGWGNTADELFFAPSPDYITHT